MQAVSPMALVIYTTETLIKRRYACVVHKIHEAFRLGCVFYIETKSKRSGSRTMQARNFLICSCDREDGVKNDWAFYTSSNLVITVITHVCTTRGETKCIVLRYTELPLCFQIYLSIDSIIRMSIAQTHVRPWWSSWSTCTSRLRLYCTCTALVLYLYCTIAASSGEASKSFFREEK